MNGLSLSLVNMLDRVLGGKGAGQDALGALAQGARSGAGEIGAALRTTFGQRLDGEIAGGMTLGSKPDENHADANVDGRSADASLPNDAGQSDDGDNYRPSEHPLFAGVTMMTSTDPAIVTQQQVSVAALAATLPPQTQMPATAPHPVVSEPVRATPGTTADAPSVPLTGTSDAARAPVAARGDTTLPPEMLRTTTQAPVGTPVTRPPEQAIVKGDASLASAATSVPLPREAQEAAPQATAAPVRRGGTGAVVTETIAGPHASDAPARPVKGGERIDIAAERPMTSGRTEESALARPARANDGEAVVLAPSARPEIAGSALSREGESAEAAPRQAAAADPAIVSPDPRGRSAAIEIAQQQLGREGASSPAVDTDQAAPSTPPKQAGESMVPPPREMRADGHRADGREPLVENNIRSGKAADMPAAAVAQDAASRSAPAGRVAEAGAVATDGAKAPPADIRPAADADAGPAAAEADGAARQIVDKPSDVGAKSPAEPALVRAQQTAGELNAATKKQEKDASSLKVEAKPAGAGLLASVLEGGEAGPLPNQAATPETGAAQTVSAGAAQSVAVSRAILDFSAGLAWIDTLAKEIAATASGDGKLSFDLAPEHLGQLSVSIEKKESGIKLAFHTSNHEAANLLASSQSQLKQELNNAGLQLGGFDIGGRAASGNEGNGGAAPGARADTPADDKGAEAALPSEQAADPVGRDDGRNVRFA